MKTELKFQINFGTGYQDVGPPTNWKGIQIEVIFTNDHPSASVQAGNFEWIGEEAKKINAYRLAGLTGGVGILEGLPLKIIACGSQNSVIFDGVINLAAQEALFECDKVTAPIRESGRIDWLEDVAGSFSFAYLASLTGNTPGRIVPSTDYKKVPYAITEIPDYTQAMLIGISLFITIKELLDVTTKISQLIAQLSGDTTTAVATGGLASGSLIATIAITVLYVTYLFAIVLIVVDLVRDLVNNIIQLKKYKLGMRCETLFQRACQYLGLQFSSTILQQGTYKDLTYIPRKDIIPSISNPLNIFDRPYNEGQGFPNNGAYGYYNGGGGTFKEFIQDMKDVFNAEVKISNGVLYFEEKHFWNVQAAYQLPNTGEVGYSHNYPDPHGTNAFELPSNFYLTFQTDPSELNTIHRYRGTSVQVTCTPNIVLNKKNLLLANSREVRLNFALAKRKEYLTRVENLLNNVINALSGFVNFIINSINGLINAINTAISFFGGNPATIGTIPTLPTNVINNRIGWMVLSNDTFSVPKLFIGTPVGNDWELHPQTESNLAAVQLLNLFHGKELPTRGNQQLTFREKRLSFCCTDYQTILNRNVLTDALGKKGKFQQMLWDIFNDQALNVEYRIYSNFTNNLTEKIVVDGA
jgi:hypothetical protein